MGVCSRNEIVPGFRVPGSYLTVLSIIDIPKTTNGHLVNALCDCGNLTEVRTASLASGRTRSCGCLQRNTARETAAAGRFKAGDTIATDAGAIVVLQSFVSSKYGYSTEFLECLCVCGEVFTTEAKPLKFNKSKSCGCYGRSQKSALAAALIPGVWREYRESRGLDPDVPMSRDSSVLRSEFARTVGRAVLIRDGFKCILCGEHADHVHHIYPWADYPAERFNPLSCAALCVDCHLNRAHPGNCREVDDEVQRHLLDLVGEHENFRARQKYA